MGESQIATSPDSQNHHHVATGGLTLSPWCTAFVQATPSGRIQAGGLPARHRPSIGDDGTFKGQVTPQVFDGFLPGQCAYSHVPATWRKRHRRIGLSRVVIRPRYHKGRVVCRSSRTVRREPLSSSFEGFWRSFKSWQVGEL